MPEKKSYNIDDLVYLMARLRDPEIGCPWDLKQDFKSIAPHTLEEVYEVIDAIESEDYSSLKDELGDLLFQVVFYSQMGEEQSLFSLSEVVSAIVEKLLVRHPHVFPEGTLDSKRNPQDSPDELQIGKTWEAIKKTQRNEKGQAGILDDIPLSLPAITRAAKLQKRAASHGFDWTSASPVFDKIDEELQELKHAVDSGIQSDIEDELGDVLFSVINVSRHLKVDGETALRGAARKFERRFREMERLAGERGDIFDDLPVQEQEKLWQLAKKRL